MINTDGATRKRPQAGAAGARSAAEPISQNQQGVAQLGNSAIEEAVRKTALTSFSAINDGLKKLADISKQGRLSTDEARALENDINKEARHVGVLIRSFDKLLAPGMADSMIRELNKMMTDGAKDIYGTSNHISWHDLSEISMVKAHITGSVLDPSDMGSVLKNLENAAKESVIAAFQKTKIDFDEMEAKFVDLKSALRDIGGLGPGRSEVIDDANKVAMLSAGPVSDNDGNKTRTEYLIEARQLKDKLSGLQRGQEYVDNLVMQASALAAAGEHSRAGKAYESALQHISWLENEKAASPSAADVLHGFRKDIMSLKLELNESAASEFMAGGTMSKAKRHYLEAAKLSGIGADTERQQDNIQAAAGAEANAKRHNKAASLYIRASLLSASKPEEESKLLIHAADEYALIANGGKEKALQHYAKAIDAASRSESKEAEDLKAMAREKIKKLEDAN